MQGFCLNLAGNCSVHMPSARLAVHIALSVETTIVVRIVHRHNPTTVDGTVRFHVEAIRQDTKPEHYVVIEFRHAALRWFALVTAPSRLAIHRVIKEASSDGTVVWVASHHSFLEDAPPMGLPSNSPTLTNARVLPGSASSNRECCAAMLPPSPVDEDQTVSQLLQCCAQSISQSMGHRRVVSIKARVLRQQQLGSNPIGLGRSVDRSVMGGKCPMLVVADSHESTQSIQVYFDARGESADLRIRLSLFGIRVGAMVQLSRVLLSYSHRTRPHLIVGPSRQPLSQAVPQHISYYLAGSPLTC